MARAGLINYSARDFSSRGEMDSHIERQDEIFTPEVVKAFNDAGLLRRVVTQIWNRDGVFRNGIIFEYAFTLQMSKHDVLFKSRNPTMFFSPIRKQRYLPRTCCGHNLRFDIT